MNDIEEIIYEYFLQVHNAVIATHRILYKHFSPVIYTRSLFKSYLFEHWLV